MGCSTRFPTLPARNFCRSADRGLARRCGALLAQAVEAEVADWPAGHSDKLTEDGRARLVRHRHLPEREVMTGIGPWRCVVHACAIASAKGWNPSAFHRRFCRPMRAAPKSLEVLILILYLKGISTGAFEEAHAVDQADELLFALKPQSWAELLLDLKRHGLVLDRLPEAERTIGDRQLRPDRVASGPRTALLGALPHRRAAALEHRPRIADPRCSLNFAISSAAMLRELPALRSYRNKLPL